YCVRVRAYYYGSSYEDAMDY
nr:immunoglobulin heavy chain junction region [Mus musculus]